MDKNRKSLIRVLKKQNSKELHGNPAGTNYKNSSFNKHDIIVNYSCWRYFHRKDRK